MAKNENAETTDTVKNIYQRIHAVMQKVDYIQKTKPKEGGMKYSSVSHDSVTAAIRPHLVGESVIYFPQNLVYKQDGNRTEVTLDLHFICADNPEDKLIVPSFGFGIDNQDKGPGKAVSYAIKYALLKTFGLETGDDPENDSIDHNKPEAKPKEEKRFVRTAPKPTGPIFKTSDERMDWVHKAGKAISELQNPEEINLWEKENDTFIKALGEKQRGWVEDQLAARRQQTYQRPLPVNGVSAH